MAPTTRAVETPTTCHRNCYCLRSPFPPPSVKGAAPVSAKTLRTSQLFFPPVFSLLNGLSDSVSPLAFFVPQHPDHALVLFTKPLTCPLSPSGCVEGTAPKMSAHQAAPSATPGPEAFDTARRARRGMPTRWPGGPALAAEPILAPESGRASWRF